MADLSCRNSGWQDALLKFRPELEGKLNIEHHISSLHEAAGGFLTTREEQDILVQSLGYNKVRKFVEILSAKTEKDFETFVKLLKNNDQPELGNKLYAAAKRFKIEGMGEFTFINYFPW